ncbi:MULTISPECIES: Rap1a/Tai family immunity protein [Pseudomonas]|uniref:Rap1a/Tai family immunity protein n=1 Tax=Pseudomonas TaxID=286 RepID=UPI0008636983|nr:MULTISPECIES: Rap1a/Tai family immunity protein [Pseudomonas]MBA6124181.1 hypothetical protein [Pseudomonas juntendi]MCF3159379.1 hypothetical protein [Pseudomonas juntendi]
MKALMAALALASMMSSGAAWADGNDLMQTCQSLLQFDDNGKANSPMKIGQCIGYMNGAIGIASELNKYLPKEDQICLPNGTSTPIQLARVVVNFMKRSPQIMSYDDGAITLAAFQAAYPCK